MTIRLLKKSNNDIKQIKEIRKVVFNDELNIPESCLVDEYDNTCDQFLIKNDQITVGVLRLRKENNAIKLERMAILPEFRNLSFGLKAIGEVKKLCVEKKESRVFLDSIYIVSDFYKMCGCTKVGKVFERVGLPHIRMEINLI